MKLESRTPFLSIFVSGAVTLALCACGGGGDSGGNANACPQAGSQGTVNGDKLADFENQDMMEFTDMTGTLLMGQAALAAVRTEQGVYGNIYIDSTDPLFIYAGAYADTRIQTFEFTAGHSSASAFRMQHNSLRLTAGGWGGGLYLGFSAPATGHTGLSLWLKGHGWGKFRVGGSGQGMTGSGGGSCEMDIPAQWTRFDIPWSSLKNDQGVSVSTPATVSMVDWWMDRTDSSPAKDDRNFEIIVDDIYLMK